ncbi:MAG: hypothetical protein WCF18_11595 [Chthoniobacteraceae bacterium]
MKPLANSILFACFAARTAFAADAPKAIQDLVLDDHTVFAVPVSGTRVTTISFPSAISAIDAALVTTDAKTAGLFQIAHTKGTSYLSARALAKGAATNLNIRWSGRTYVLELKESAAPWLSVIFQPQDEGKGTRQRPVTPSRLLGLLDKAKAFPLLSEYHPEAMAGVDFRDGSKQPGVTDCGDYEVRMNEAFRFDLEDTLVFRLTLQNKTLEAIQFAPERVRLKVGSHTLFPSVTQLGGLIPANGTSDGYVAFTGTADGERNDLSLKNEFTFVLERAPALADELPAKNEEGYEK